MPKITIFGIGEDGGTIVLETIKSQDISRARDYVAARYVIDDDLTYLFYLLFDGNDVRHPPKAVIVHFSLVEPLPAPAGYNEYGIDEGDLIRKIGIIRFPNDEDAGIRNLDEPIGGGARSRRNRRSHKRRGSRRSRGTRRRKH